MISEKMMKTEMGRQALIESQHCVRMFDQKQADYGSRNIACFEDNLFNMFGVSVRLNDKLQRSLNLLQQQIKDPSKKPNNESLLDTARDVSNYGLILSLLAQNKWK
jgi:hypothetical protein